MAIQDVAGTIYNKDGIKPEFVISTEPTDGGIYRGHRGRMEIRVDVHGTSCHGSAPDRGDNAIYKMADIIADVRALPGANLTMTWPSAAEAGAATSRTAAIAGRSASRA